MSDPQAVEVPALVTLPGVDILATGTWKLSSGEATFTTEDLAAAVDASLCPAVGPPVIKIGHTDKRFTPGDGEPAIGRVVNLSLAAEGNKITGDLSGMPGWLGDILPSAYPQRSVEGAYDLVCQIGHVHPFVITALALLGVTPPGVGVLNGLEDVAALYGVTATGQFSARAWQLRSGDPMAGIVLAAGVTTEDVRRAYYDNPATTFAMWITEMQLDPPQLIVADESTNQVYRVPVTIKGSEVTFGDPVQVSVEYVDSPAKKAASRAVAVAYASKEASREGIAAAWDAGAAQKNLGDDPTSAQLGKLYALPGDTKSDSKLPHHDVSSAGVVGAANDDGCSAAIGAINGAHGGIKGVSGADAKKAYNHLAAHLTADGKDAPEYDGPAAAAEDPEAAAEAEGEHAAAGEAVTHSHSHSAFGTQGDDETHTHEHSHAAGEPGHDHHEAQASRGGQTRGAAEMDFSDDQMKALRVRLGKGDEDELTAEEILAALAQEPEPGSRVAASRLPEGVIAIDKDVFEAMNRRIAVGEAAAERQLRGERDGVITAAMRDGKFPLARKEAWERLWDKDPEGTRAVLAGLTPGVVPLDDIGVPGGPGDDLLDSEYKSIFPPAYKHEAAQ